MRGEGRKMGRRMARRMGKEKGRRMRIKDEEEADERKQRRNEEAGGAKKKHATSTPTVWNNGKPFIFLFIIIVGFKFSVYSLWLCRST